jgi:hypothetical protein
MADHVQNAEKLGSRMLDERRRLVDSIVNGDETSTDNLRRLAAIEETIALAASIKSDELTRAKEGEYDRHRKAGTLEHDDFRDVTLP